MSLVNAKNVTDEQWIALMGLIGRQHRKDVWRVRIDNDDEWTVIMPEAPGESVRGWNPQGKPFVIVADGDLKVRSNEAGL